MNTEETLNVLYELRNIENDIARKYTLYRRIEKSIEEKDKEIERLNNIIKEVREKVESSYDNEDSYGDFEIHWELKKELLEILDKEREVK